MNKSTSVRVDLSKANRVMREENLNQKQLAFQLGHEPSYWSGIKKTGRMKRCDALLFKSLFGVDIEIKEGEQVAKQEVLESNSVEIDYDKLAEVMANIIDYEKLSEAMYKAMVRALNGDTEGSE